MSCKWACFLCEKLLKTIYLLLLIILMTLWIVLCVEATRQITEVGHLKQKGKLEDQHRKVLPLSAGMGGTAFTASTIAIANRYALPRLHALTIFNTILEEVIALVAILSLLFTVRRLASLSLLLLVLIWFIEQYRISDLYHQIDYIDANNARIIIATHVIHFIVCLLGIGISCIDSFTTFRVLKREQSSSGERVDSEAPVLTTITSSKMPKLFASQSFEDLERAEEEKRNDKKRACAWIRSSTIVKKIHGRGKKANVKQLPLAPIQSLPTSSGSSSSEGERPFLVNLKKKRRSSSTANGTDVEANGNRAEAIETPIEIINSKDQLRGRF